MLSRLHFEVRLNHNITKDEIQKLLEEASSQNHSDADCFMFVIMSHGNILSNGGLGVLGVDNNNIDIEAQAKLLFSNKKCPSLNNKPKLFFVDACWGNGLMEGTFIFPTSSANISDSCNIYTNTYSSITSTPYLPDISDFLFSFSTLPNYFSLRDKNKGNWFIQNLTSTLDEFGEMRTLSDIMHKVRQQLMFKTTPLSAQMSVDHWMLSRNVFFRSKEKKIFCSSQSNTFLLNVRPSLKSIAPNEIDVLNTFDYLPLLTRIGTSCKFASLSPEMKSIHVWILYGKEKEMLHVLSGHSHTVTALHSFETIHDNKNMNVLASGSEDGSIRIWDVYLGECLQTIRGHKKTVVSLKSVGTTKLASSSLDNTIRVWDISLHFILNDSFVVRKTVYALRVPQTSEQDRGWLVLAYGKNIHVFNSKTCKIVRNISMNDFISRLEYVDEHRIACCSIHIDTSCTIQIWNLETNSCESTIIENNFKSFHWLGDNKLAIVGADECIYIWNVNSQSTRLLTIQTVKDSSALLLLSFPLDENEFLCGFTKSDFKTIGAIKVWNIENGECVHIAQDDEKDTYLISMLLIGNGKFVVNCYNQKIRIWDTLLRINVREFKHGFIIIDLFAIILLEWLGGDLYAAAHEHTIRIWNLHRFQRDLNRHTSDITVLKWLENNMMASGSKDGKICIWQVETGECLDTFHGHSRRVQALTLFGENRMASAALNEKIRVWNIAILPESKICNIQKQDKDITDNDYLLYTKNTYLFKLIGTEKLAIVFPNKIRVWNVVNDTYLPDLNFLDEENKFSIIYALRSWRNFNEGETIKTKFEINFLKSHGTSTLIGVADSTITTWNVDTGKCLYTLIDHHKKVTSLVISSKILISGSLDQYIRVWDINTGVLRKFIHINDQINSMHVISDSMLAVKTSKDIKLFDLRTYDLFSCYVFTELHFNEYLKSLSIEYFFE